MDNKQAIIESLARALESWVRHASAAQLWQVQQHGGLGASIAVEEDTVHVRIELGGPRNPLSDLGRTDGRLPVTEAFLGNGAAAWGAPPRTETPRARPGFCRTNWPRNMRGSTCWRK